MLTGFENSVRLSSSLSPPDGTDLCEPYPDPKFVAAPKGSTLSQADGQKGMRFTGSVVSQCLLGMYLKPTFSPSDSFVPSNSVQLTLDSNSLPTYDGASENPQRDVAVRQPEDCSMGKLQLSSLFPKALQNGARVRPSSSPPTPRFETLRSTT